jgi:Carboxypeptidase regulatory-like domain
MTLWLIFLTALGSGSFCLWAGQSSPQPQNPAPVTIGGAVTDASGLVVMGAVVTLQSAAPAGRRTTVTDETGSFHFAAVEPGSYTLAIAADGFAAWTAPNIVVRAGGKQPSVSAVLQVAPNSSSVDVGLPPHELAVEQVKAEEKQRLLGVFPNFFVTYEPNPAPLNAAQKFQLGWKTIIDPVTLLSSALTAGIEQAHNSYHQWGQGMEGFGRRFGADYADEVNGVIIGHVLMQSVFHQDPRYFYKGRGSFRSRALYAFATAFVCKGDNGHWQPDYGDVLGDLASGEISTLYYPASSRIGLRLFHDVLLGFAGRIGGNLFEEFLLRKVTTHVPKTALTQSGPILREGTPVSLISIEDLNSKTAKDSGPISFVLAGDIQVDGAIVAKAGSKAWGQVSYASGPGAEIGAIGVGLDHVHFKVGSTEVPLRSTPARKGAGTLEYRRLEDSGRIAIVLYVAATTALPPAR